MVLLVPGVVGAVRHAPVRMPDLVGRSRVQVFRVMHDDGLYFETLGPGSNNGTWRRVAAQTPRAGAMIAWHGRATLMVTTVLPRGPRRVPLLVGLSRPEVFAVMRRAQLFFVTVGPGSSNGSWIVALAQSRSVGSRIAWHGEIRIRVSTVRPRPVVKRPTPVTATTPVKATTASSGSNFKIGIATWYNYVPGRCATWYLPEGTRLTVLDLSTGKSVTCVITDREVEGSDHVVDLDTAQFSELAPLSQGVINVKVSW